MDEKHINVVVERTRGHSPLVWGCGITLGIIGAILLVLVVGCGIMGGCGAAVVGHAARQYRQDQGPP